MNKFRQIFNFKFLFIATSFIFFLLNFSQPAFADCTGSQSWDVTCYSCKTDPYTGLPYCDSRNETGSSVCRAYSAQYPCHADVLSGGSCTINGSNCSTSGCTTGLVACSYTPPTSQCPAACCPPDQCNNYLNDSAGDGACGSNYQCCESCKGPGGDCSDPSGVFGFFFYQDVDQDGQVDNGEALALRSSAVASQIRVNVIVPSVEGKTFTPKTDGDWNTLNPWVNTFAHFNKLGSCGDHSCIGPYNARTVGGQNECECLTALTEGPNFLNEGAVQDVPYHYAYIDSSIRLAIHDPPICYFDIAKSTIFSIDVPSGWKIVQWRDRGGTILAQNATGTVSTIRTLKCNGCADNQFNWDGQAFLIGLAPAEPTPPAYIFGKAVREDAGGTVIERWTADSCNGCDSDCRREPNLDVVCSGGGISSGVDWKCNQVGMSYYQTGTVFTPGSDVTCTLSGLPLGYVCKDPAQGTTTCTQTKSNVVSGSEQNYLLFSIKPGTVTISGGSYDVSPHYDGSPIACSVFNPSLTGLDSTVTFNPTGTGTGDDCLNAPTVSLDSSGSTGYTSSDLRYNCQYQASAQSGGLFQVVTQITGIVNPDDCQNGETATFTPNYLTTGQVNFGLAEIAGSWLQVVGGDVTSYHGSVNSPIPATCAGSDTCLAYIDINESGVSYPVFAENGIVIADGSIDYGDSDDAGVGNPNDWQVDDSPLWREQGKGAQYYASLLADRLESGDTSHGSTTLSDILSGDVGSNTSEIRVVEGNLTIDRNVNVARGGLLLVLVTGNITINNDVFNVEGVFVANGAITILGTDENDPQIILEGTYLADADNQGNEGVTNDRDRGAKNNLTPPALFRYRPDLVVSLLKTNIPLGSALEWEELAP